MKQPKSAATFEARMARLQEIVAALEGGELPLEKGVALYKEGMELSRSCREQLEKARNDIRVFTDGVLQPFAGDAGSVDKDAPHENDAPVQATDDAGEQA